ncbi:hypothetical protein HDU87_007555 [Geranomyces variabilis]|uniref:Xylanolytic transcriptional activator regulatory domain-containing protein n=1 Tax=Geranomyces variabilis TaxID=109894 RepID=A0AAD5TSI5_9FUNG|nr:hypothetical protein HDU87_007555 [Geranomyces variabilis]
MIIAQKKRGPKRGGGARNNSHDDGPGAATTTTDTLLASVGTTSDAALASDWERRRNSLVSSSYYTTDEYSDEPGDFQDYGNDIQRREVMGEHSNSRTSHQLPAVGHGGGLAMPSYSSSQTAPPSVGYFPPANPSYAAPMHSDVPSAPPGHHHPPPDNVRMQAAACSWAAESVNGPAGSAPADLSAYSMWPTQMPATSAYTTNDRYMKRLAAMSTTASGAAGPCNLNIPPPPMASQQPPPPRPRPPQPQHCPRPAAGLPAQLHLHLHFVSLYFTYFHPTLPIVDERGLLAALLSPSAQAHIAPPSLALVNAVYSIGVLYSARRDALAVLGGRHRASAEFARASRAALQVGGDLVARCLLDVRTFGCALENEDNDWELFASAWRIAQKLQLGYDQKVESLFAVINGPRNVASDANRPELVTKSERKRAWWGLFTVDTFVSLSTGFDLSIDEALYTASLLDTDSFVTAESHSLAGEKVEAEGRCANSQPGRAEYNSVRLSTNQAVPSLGASPAPVYDEANWASILGGYPEDSIFGPGSQTPLSSLQACLEAPAHPLRHLFTSLSSIHSHIRISIFFRKVMRTVRSSPIPGQIASLHAKTMQLIYSFPPVVQRYLHFANVAGPSRTDAAPPIATICVHTILMFCATVSMIHQSGTSDLTTTHRVGAPENGGSSGAYMTSVAICAAVYRLASNLIQDIYTSRPTPVPRPPHELVSSPFAATLITAIAVPLLATRTHAMALASAIGEGGKALPALDEAILPALEDMAAVWPRAASYARQLRGWIQVVRMRPPVDAGKTTAAAFDL